MMTSYEAHLSSKDQYVIVDERTHRGKRTVKNLLTYVDNLMGGCEQNAKDALLLAKTIPAVEGHTTRYALHRASKMHEAQNNLYKELHEQLANGAKAQLTQLLNEDFRGKYPKLQTQAKEHAKKLSELEKTERDAHKKSIKAINAHQQLRVEIFEGHKILDQHALIEGEASQEASSSSPLGPTKPDSDLVNKEVHAGKEGKRRWTMLKLGKLVSGLSQQKSTDSAGAKQSISRTHSKKSVRKLSQNMAKLVKKLDGVADAETLAKEAHAEAAARLLEGQSVYNESMAPILNDFQDLELHRASKCKSILINVVERQLEHYKAIMETLSTTLDELNAIDPTADLDYFIRAARSVANPWRRLSGNIPCITQEYHQPVSPWMQVLDGESGRHFFMHNETGEMVWDQPLDDKGEPIDVQPSYANLNIVPPVMPLPSMMQRKMQNGKESNGKGGTEWEAVVDEDSGHEYFHNPLTGQSSWEAPPTGSGTLRVSDLARTNPDEWQMLKDARTGATYYYKASTGESRWA